MGGGAILDLGCYPVSFSVLIAKLISKFDSNNIGILNKKVQIGDTGVDLDSYAEINFGKSFKSYVSASFSKDLGKKTIIKGTLGKLVIEDTWHGSPSSIKILGKNNKEINIISYDNIYSYEIEVLSKCILENKKNPVFPGLTINDTFENMKILDKWLNHGKT